MKIAARIITAIFFLILMGFSWNNRELTIDGLYEGYEKEQGLVGIAESVQAQYKTDELYKKNDLINLNGLYNRLTGRRVLNDTVLLKNGYINSQNASELNMIERAQKVVELSDWVQEQGIQFLYVQMPYKLEVDEKSLPIGIENGSNENADQILEILNAHHVNTVDLRDGISATSEQVMENFYKTDHHWTPIGAFKGFNITAEALQKLFPNEKIMQQDMLNIEQWDIHTMENHFLGSQGKRVGQLFVGMDDLVWMTPKFDTYMSCAIHKDRQIMVGDYTSAVIQKKYLNDVEEIQVSNKPGTYFNVNQFCVYIGGDYPLVTHKNKQAPIDKKVLIIKDSFSLPYQTFLATMFTEVETFDPRRNTEVSIAAYIKQTKPDVVLFAINPSVFGEKKYFDYGIESLPDYTKKSVIYENDIMIPAREEKYNYATIKQPLESNTTYCVSIEDVVYTTGGANGFCVAFYDAVDKKIMSTYIFDRTYQKSDYVWYFKTPDNVHSSMNVIVYSGIPGQCQNIGTSIENLKIEKIG